MLSENKPTNVVIIGAGVAGLTAAYMLLRNGIPCVVLERQNREGLQKRNRAGVVEPRATMMFEQWGLGHILGNFPSENLIEFRLNGNVHRTEQYPGEDGAPAGKQCPQQMLMKSLLDAYLEEGGDLRFNVKKVELSQLENDVSLVRYEDEDGQLHEISADIIAGCDGARGISRNAIPADKLTVHREEYGVTWLVVLAQVPSVRHPVYGMSDSGFVGQFPRGPGVTRYYLQIDPRDTQEDWPDDRIWSEIKIRMGDDNMPTGAILETDILPLEALVCEPMRYGNLFLTGDAAHLFSPTGGKGANCAMFDAEAFARGVIEHVKNGDRAALDAYSDICVEHAWNYQEFSAWILELLHDIGDPKRAGTFRKGIAKARLDRILRSDAAARAYRELAAGLD